jgi:ankyrin repeat protein
VASGVCLRVLEGHTAEVVSVCVLGDGRLASASWDKTIRIWPKHLSTPIKLIPHIKTGNLPKVLELINDGYDINSTTENPLLVACEHNQLPCVQLLLELGADIEIKDSKGKTALICASKNGYLDIVIELINNGANVDAKDNDGKTALICASKNGYLDIVTELINNGANVEATDNDGKTALIISSNRDKLEIVKELLNNGANIDARDNKKMTSILSMNINVVKELLSRGANVEIWPDIFDIFINEIQDREYLEERWPAIFINLFISGDEQKIKDPEIKELLLAYRQNK